MPINFCVICVSCNSMLGMFRVSVRLFCDLCVPYARRQFSLSCQFLCNLMSSVCLSSCVYIQCNQAREQNFLKSHFWAKNYTDSILVTKMATTIIFIAFYKIENFPYIATIYRSHVCAGQFS